MQHICSKEKEIGIISNNLNRVMKIIDGNGKPGLADEVPRLANATDDLKEQIAGLATSISGFVKFQSDMLAYNKANKEAEEKVRLAEIEKEKAKLNGKWMIGTLISLIAILVGIILKFIIIA